MKDSIVVIFLANGNHLSNVKTLQSIYRQNYENINVIICNDHTYGFQSERLLNNFQNLKPDNIRQLYYRENPYVLGEYGSQAQFWKMIDSEFVVTIHSGEYLTSPSVLTECIRKINVDKSVAALVTGAELWNDDFKRLISVDCVAEEANSHQLLNAVGDEHVDLEKIRDCMVVYRLSALRKLQLQLNNDCTQISRYIVSEMLNNGSQLALSQLCLCKYSLCSIEDDAGVVPAKFGNETLNNIAKLLQERAVEEQMLFHSTLETPARKQGRNIHIMLHKLSTFKKISAYIVLSLLLFIAAALFLHLEYTFAPVMGAVFLIFAGAALLLATFMLFCNLYYKKYPQRLVKIS